MKNTINLDQTSTQSTYNLSQLCDASETGDDFNDSIWNT